MIDYEKLKIAQQMALKSECLYFTCEFGIDDRLIFEIFNTDNDSEGVARDEDELIEMLQNLTVSKSKSEDEFVEQINELKFQINAMHEKLMLLLSNKE